MKLTDVIRKRFSDINDDDRIGYSPVFGSIKIELEWCPEEPAKSPLKRTVSAISGLNYTQGSRWLKFWHKDSVITLEELLVEMGIANDDYGDKDEDVDAAVHKAVVTYVMPQTLRRGVDDEGRYVYLPYFKEFDENRPKWASQIGQMMGVPFLDTSGLKHTDYDTVEGEMRTVYPGKCLKIPEDTILADGVVVPITNDVKGKLSLDSKLSTEEKAKALLDWVENTPSGWIETPTLDGVRGVKPFHGTAEQWGLYVHNGPWTKYKKDNKTVIDIPLLNVSEIPVVHVHDLDRNLNGMPQCMVLFKGSDSQPIILNGSMFYEHDSELVPLPDGLDISREPRPNILGKKEGRQWREVRQAKDMAQAMAETMIPKGVANLDDLSTSLTLESYVTAYGYESLDDVVLINMGFFGAMEEEIPKTEWGLMSKKLYDSEFAEVADELV